MELFSSQTHQVTTFEDALGLGFELTYYYEYGHFGLLLTGDNQVHSIFIFDRPEDTVYTALSQLGTVSEEPHQETGMCSLLISVVHKDLDQLCYADLTTFEWAQRQMQQTNCPLKDWIEINNELYRSYAFTQTPNSAWNSPNQEAGRLSGVD